MKKYHRFSSLSLQLTGAVNYQRR